MKEDKNLLDVCSKNVILRSFFNNKNVKQPSCSSVAHAHTEGTSAHSFCLTLSGTPGISWSCSAHKLYAT